MKKRILSFVLSIIMVMLIAPQGAYFAQAADFETQLREAGFTESYVSQLTQLHKQHPNWSFKPLITNENFNTAVDNERKPHNQQLIQKWSGNDGKGYYCTCENDYKNGSYVPREGSGWISASKTAVQYYMDPRNFLNEQYIFQFLSNEYNSSHTQSGVETILKGTWMYDSVITYKDASGKTVTYKDSNGNTVKYSKAIMIAAKDSGLSAYYLASKIKQEVGGANPTAGGAKGTGNGDGNYKGIYNYYNINATTGYSAGLEWAATTPSTKWLSYGGCNMRKGPSKSTDIVIYLENGTPLTYIDTTSTQSDGYKWVHVSATVNGKTYTGYIREDLVVKPSTTVTYNRPWTNPYLSIYNGAQWIADNYKTQNTGYLQKFNVNPASSNRHSHEYMANVQGAASEGYSVYTAYKSNGWLDNKMTFIIPVFTAMPGEVLAAPTNLVLSNTTTNGVTISYSKVAGADGYEIQYYHDGKWTHYVNTGYTSKKWEGAGWGPAGTYDIRVRAYIKTGSGLAYSENWSETKRFYTKPAKVTGLTTTSRSSDGTSLTLKWDAQKWATGYVVYRKGPNNTWVQLVTLTSPTENTYTVKGLTPVYDYGYRVRAYKGGSGNLGAYSDIHSTYTLPPKTKLYTVAQNGKGRMYVSWNLAKSYGYEVILSTKADFSSGNLKYTVSGMYNNKTNLRNLAAKNYYVKVRPYYNKPFGKIYGSWSDAKQIKLS